jgi:hypothetical protein
MFGYEDLEKELQKYGGDGEVSILVDKSNCSQKVFQYLTHNKFIILEDTGIV